MKIKLLENTAHFLQSEPLPAFLVAHVNLVPRPSKLLTLLSEGLVCKIIYWVGGVKETH